MSFLVRPALPEELDAAGELVVTAYLADDVVAPDSPYLEDLRDAAGRSGDSLVLAAVDDGTLLGSVTWCPDGSSHREVARPGEGEFRCLGVAPAARRRGVARALVQACLDRAGLEGYSAVVLSSSVGMVSAHRLYENLRFTRLPERDWEPVPGMLLLAYRRELG